LNGCGIIEYILKNKANLADGQMNVRSFQERDYDDFAGLRRQKKQSQNKANFSAE